MILMIEQLLTLNPLISALLVLGGISLLIAFAIIVLVIAEGASPNDLS